MQAKTEKPTNPLTPRQLQLLQAIASFQTSRCYCPTIAELAVELGVSRSTAFEHIAELRRKQLLSAYPNKARSLKLTFKAQKLLKALGDQNSDTHYHQSAGIPLAGTVAAGLPIEAVEQRDHLSLSSHFGNRDSLFALEVRGDSMADDDIRDGDFVICRRSCLANDGQLVIALVDNENATLKRFYRQKSCARLQPANKDYAPIYTEACRIQAVVVGLLRKL
ncbi:MAG: transcriptional repressor LexA [Planctomycetota bacterium]|jgi:repressor LexA